MKAGSALEDMGGDGSFKRKATDYHDKISGSDVYEPEANRYHLYVSLACPWAAGVLSALHLKGLENVITHSVVHPTWGKTRPDDPSDQHFGWMFYAPGDPAVKGASGHGAFPCDEALIPDPHGAKALRDVYEKCTKRQSLGDAKAVRCTTPVLWDNKTGSIVNNESTELLRILNDEFQQVAKHPSCDLFSSEEAQALHDWIYPGLLNGVYRAGFAKSQAAYEEAVHDVFSTLARLDEHLSSRRFLCGDKLAWVDIRVYHTLVRFDPVYSVYFKCNVKSLVEFTNVVGYVRDMYQTFEALRKTTNFDHIKTHYYTSHAVLNAYSIIPAGQGPNWEAPHHRDHLISK